MNAAVPPPYASYHHHQHGSDTQTLPSASYPGAAVARMVKRRRLDSAGDEYGVPDDWDQQHLRSSLATIPAFGNPPAPNPDYGGNARAHDVAAAGATVGTDGSTGAWQGSSSVTGGSSYPANVSSYPQQPYYSFQPADPTTYNSPWPPTAGSSFGNPSGNYSIPAPPPSSAPAMPYFPPQSTAGTGETGFIAETALPVSSYTQDLDLTSSPPQYATSQTHSVPPPPPSQQQPTQRSDGSTTSSTLYFEDASMHLKIQSLSILENLATQLIHTIAKANFPQIREIMRGTDSEDSQAYTTLKNLFDQTRKVYSRESPFIDAIAIQMFQPAQQEVIRKANIATFISSILGAHDVSFFHLNEFFMETFVPLGHRLLKWQGAIYLELKTQTYISALINSDGSPQAMLDELFPADLDAQILTRHPDAPSLSPSEQDFIDRSRQRKNYLLADNNTEEALRELSKKYQWQDFVREFASCIAKNVDGIMNVPARSQPNFSGNAADRRAAAAAAALNSSSTSHQHGGRNASNHNATQPYDSTGAANRDGLSTTDVTTGKKSSTSNSTIRQPWTKPEEDALLSGLARVNGPHWSQILALYGRGGSISEVLKDRNQVQLKDKARNLKLWYLKMGKDVPPALRGVTGELRKRGGARARAALGMMEDDEQGDGDAEGEVEGDEMDVGLDGRGGGAKGARKGKRR